MNLSFSPCGRPTMGTIPPHEGGKPMHLKQGLCVVLALATACTTSAFLAKAAVKEPSVAANVAPAAAFSPRSPNDRSAPGADEATAFSACIRAETLTPGAVIDLLSPNRKLLQRLSVNDQHEVVADAVSPGKYIIENDEIGSVLFTLHENASLSVLGGSGWTDGEILYLSKEENGTLCVLCYVPITDVDAKQGLCCTYSLLSEDYASDRILHFSVETEQTDDYYVQSCIFAGLREGTYSLIENGIDCQTVTISADEQSVKVSRYPLENAK